MISDSNRRGRGISNESVLAGTMDGDAGGIKLDRHIFVEDKGDYYEIGDGLPQFSQSD